MIQRIGNRRNKMKKNKIFMQTIMNQKRKDLSTRHIIHSLMMLMALVCQGSLIAQYDTTLSMESEFVNNRKLFLRDANKLSLAPEIKVQEVPMTGIQYSTLPTRKNFDIQPSLIAAAKVNVDEKLPYYYRGFVRAGFGSYNTVPAELYYTDGRSKKGTFGMHYQLLRSDGVLLNDKDSIPDRYSDNRGELWGKRFFKKFTLGGYAKWERNVTHWYGFNNTDTSIIKRVIMDSLRQRLNSYSGHVYYETFNRDSSDWNYDFDLGMRKTMDLYKENETNIDFKSSGHRLMDSERYNLEVGFNYNKFNYFGPRIDRRGQFTDAYVQQRSWDNGVIKLGGTVQTTWRDLRAKVGAGIYFDLKDLDRPARAYPILEVNYNIAHGIVVPYAGVSGSTVPTTFYSLYSENPFINTFPNLRNLNNRLHAYGGIGGSISRSLSYKVGVNYLSQENFAYFINDSIYFNSPSVAPALLRSVGNRFNVVYDNLKTFNVFGELALYESQKWKANLRGDWFQYQSGSQAHAWQQPGLKITANGQYQMRDKIFLTADVFYIGKRWVKSNIVVAGQERAADGSYQYTLKGFLDLNLRAEYRYNKRISVWAQVSNALSLKYQRYSAYPTQRLLGILGFSFSF
jgi:hypothetical protein